MHRFWIGLLILTLTLAAAVGVTTAMPRLHQPIRQLLEDASDAALREDWATAADLTQEAAQRWERCRNFTAAVADHEPMEAIDTGFAQVQAFLLKQDSAEFPAACAALARAVEAMACSQQLVWWNFL